MNRRIIMYTLVLVGLLALAIGQLLPGAPTNSMTALATSTAVAPAEPALALPNTDAPAYPAAVVAAPGYPAAVDGLPVAPAYPVAPTVSAPQAPVSQAPVYGYTVVNVYPHDPGAFTQGLVYTDGVLYEGTGRNGQSSLRRVGLVSGEVQQQVDLAADYFGEGVAVLGDKIYQLTWLSGKGFIYDRASLAPAGEWSYPGQGWGLTHDGSRLIMSDGTSEIRFLKPETLEELGRIQVLDGNAPVTQLNELEYIDGQIFANIWQTDRIARIDPVSGQVTAWIDLSGLLTPEERSTTDVLNGIAYDVEGGRLFVTGKLWPKLFEITLVPPQAVLPHKTVLPAIFHSA